MPEDRAVRISCGISVVRDPGALIVSCLAHGYLGRFATSSSEESSGSPESLFREHLAELATRSEVVQTRRRQRENLDAFINSASQGVGVVLAEARAMYDEDHETVVALDAAMKLVALSRRFNGDD